MDFKERIERLAIALGTNKTQLQQEIGVSNAYFANVNKVSGKVAQTIRDKYPRVNIDWLNGEEGGMFVDDNGISGDYIVPLVPVSAMAGSLGAFNTGVFGYECERIVSPVRNASLAITVSGESMSPEYPNGCKVLLKKIDERSFIEWGRVYVLDTANGAVIKVIFPCKDDESKVVCHSINKDYPDFTVDKADVTGWYRVMMTLALK